VPDWKQHALRRPTFEEEEARERLMPYDSEMAGKVNGHDAVRTTFHEEPANIALYDRVVQTVGNYFLDESVRRFADHPVLPPKYHNMPRERDVRNMFEQIGAGRYDEEYRPGDVIEELDANEVIEVTGDEGKVLATVKTIIPGWHKTKIISEGLYGGDYRVDMEGVKTYGLGASREWCVVQEIGGGRRPDGSTRPPQFVIRYFFGEPKEKHRHKMRTRGVNSVGWQEKGGVSRDRRVANLPTIRDVFGELIRRVEGGTIAGGPVNVADRQHLAFIFGNFKKLALGTLFRSLEADLGNSSAR
jgi:hypothetical protein